MKHQKKSAQKISISESSPYRISAIATLAWSIFIALTFFKKAYIEIGSDQFMTLLHQWVQTPFIVMPMADACLRHGAQIGILAAITLILLFTGRKLLNLSNINCDNRWEKSVLSFALGYGTWGTCLLLIGLAGHWSRTVLIALFALALIWTGMEALLLYRKIDLKREFDFGPPKVSTIFYVSGFLIVWLFVLGYALIPETFYDALEYHLSLPNLYLLNSGIIPTPENSYSGTPGLAWMLYGWTLALDSWGIRHRRSTTASRSGRQSHASAYAEGSEAQRRVFSRPQLFFSCRSSSAKVLGYQ
jgi:hypothetical protein